MSDKLLFTPGPVTTSRDVKQAMQRDLGSRDTEFIRVVREIRSKLEDLAGGGFEAVLIPGPGMFAIESVIGSAIPPDGRLLVAANGANGRGLREIAARLRIDVDEISFSEESPVPADAVAEALRNRGPFTHVAAVHCETATGILNPIDAIGTAVAASGGAFIVDARSSFGGIAMDLRAARVDYLVSSADQCMQGVPGVAFVLARAERLRETESWARSVSLDLFAQWRALENDGQFRFTPPIHALLAFRRALEELELEGGVAGRCARYRSNHQALMEEARKLELRPYLAAEHQSPILTSFRYPEDAAFDCERFYSMLRDRGLVIHPGKPAQENCFGIATIGHLTSHEIRRLCRGIREVLTTLGVATPK